MSEKVNSVHLDSRRNQHPGKPWQDYEVQLDDVEAVETSPFGKELEGLKVLGFDKVVIFYTDSIENNGAGWVVSAQSFIAEIEKMLREDLEGKFFIDAEVDEEGQRTLSGCFGYDSGDHGYFDASSVQEKVWLHLEEILGTLYTPEDEATFAQSQNS